MAAALLVCSGMEEVPKGTPWADRHVWQIQPVRDLLFVAALLAVYWLFSRLSLILMPVLFGLILAYIFNPLVNWARRRTRLPRPLSAILIMVVIFGSLAAAGVFLGPLLVAQVTALVEVAPAYGERLAQRYDIELDEGAFEWALRQLREQAEALWRVFGGVVGATIAVVLWLLLTPASFFIFTWKLPKVWAQARQYIPTRRRERVLHVLGKMDRAVGEFFRGRILVALIAGVLFSISFLLAAIPFWFVLGMITGLLGIIPYISGIGWVLAMLFKYLEQEAATVGFTWMAVVIWPSVAFWIPNQIEEWVVAPLVHRHGLPLSAFAILIVVLLGGILAGFIGLLLAIPIAACLKILGAEVLLPAMRRWARSH